MTRQEKLVCSTLAASTLFDLSPPKHRGNHKLWGGKCEKSSWFRRIEMKLKMEERTGLVLTLESSLILIRRCPRLSEIN